MYNQALPDRLNMGRFNQLANRAAALPAQPIRHRLFGTHLFPVRCIMYTLIVYIVLRHGLLLEKASRLVPLVLLAVFVLRHTSSASNLPEVPSLEGLSFLRVILLSMTHRASGVVDRLLDIAIDGISCASVAGNVLVFVHNTAMIRQLLAMPEEFITREITKDSSGFSPTWLLRRIVGPSLPNYTGPHLSTYRAGFIREFNSTESLAKDFDAIKTLAQTHVNGLIDEQANSATVNIISHIDIFAISLWRTILYGSSDSETDSRALSLAKEIGARVTDPWPSLWYSINVILGFVDAGEPLGSDKVLRDQLDDLITDSVQNLEDYERLNPQAPPTSLRGLSARTHGSVLEGLSQTAIEFARLNAFTGNETFGYNLAWLVIELDKWPECLQKLLAEIGCSDTADFKTVNSNIPYLDAVITEVNRLHPPIASTFRTVNREINVISRKSHYKLQLGTIVFLALGCANRSVKDWGKDADLFVPERWLGKTEGIPPHLAFGYGSRSCVGYRTALLGTKMYLVELLRRYHVVLKKHDYRVSPGEILGVESPLTIELYERQPRRQHSSD